MGIDPFTETIVSLSQATKQLPRVRGKKVAISTVWRWARGGMKAPDGTRVVLQTVRIGGTTCTSLEALRRFFDVLTPVSGDLTYSNPAVNATPGWQPGLRTTSVYSREKRVREAERELRMDGFDGDGQIFARSTISKELLCDLHELIHQRMPAWAGKHQKAYRMLRSGVFAHAVRIIEESTSKRRGYASATDWVCHLDLLGYKIRELPGVGPLTESEWNELKADATFQRFFSATWTLEP